MLTLAAGRMWKTAAGDEVPTPTLFVVVVFEPLVVHCALAAGGLSRHATSKTKAAARKVSAPREPCLVVVILFSFVE
jgi:hypothetical protein